MLRQLFLPFPGANFTIAEDVEFSDLIASSELLLILLFERGAIHALNTLRKETYLHLGAINNPAITIANLHSLIDQHCNS